MNEKDKEMEYQKGLTELYEKTQEMGRGYFVKMIYDLKEELDITNKKLEDVKEFVNKSIRPEYRNGNSNEFYLEMNEKELKKFLSIIGGE